MHQFRSVAASLRAFWADPAQRRVLMWVLAAIGAVILVYGVVQAVRAQLDYLDRGDKLDAAEKQAEALEQSLGLNYNPDQAATVTGATPAAETTPSAEVTAEGETTPLIGVTPAAQPTAPGEDGPELSQSDAVLVMTLRSQVRQAETEQIQAYNRRSEGIRMIGIGLIVLALAYLVAPTGKRAAEVPPGSEASG